MSKTLREIMTERPRAVTADASISDVVEVMESEDIGAVPIVDPDGRLLAIVTDRDLALRVLGNGRNPSETAILDVASREPLTAAPDTPFDTALTMMAEHRVRRLPVIDENGTLVGIVSQADVALAGKEKETGELLAELSAPRPGPRI